MSHISKSKFFRIVRCLQCTYLYEDTYSYQSKQICTPSSLSGVIVACPSRSNSSLPLILTDTLPLGKHFFPFGFLISYAYDSSIDYRSPVIVDIFTIQSTTTTVL